MLTDLQRRVRRIISDLPESGAFALAGGAALIVTGVVQRPTNDLDFFAPHPQSVAELVHAVRAQLEAEGLKTTIWRAEPTFARLQIDSGDDSTAIDLATDFRLLPASATDQGPVLAIAELAADKVLALEARAEARDYIDFQALTSRFTIEELCDLAKQKDLGFRPQHLLRALAHFDKIDPAEFNAYTPSHAHLRASIAAAHTQLTELVQQRALDDNTPKSDRGIDIGF